MDDNNGHIKILVDTLEKQVTTLESVLKITKEQADIAGRDVFDENLFYDTLSRKDGLIIRLNELDDGFVTVYERVRKLVRDNPEQYKSDVARMQELIRRCTDLGNEIQTLENRNRDKLVNCFAGKKQEYSARQAAATVVGKYNATMRNGFTGTGYRFNQDK